MHRPLFAALVVLVVAGVSQAGIVADSGTCTFPDDPNLVKHSYCWDYTPGNETLTLHEGPVYQVGPDCVTIAGEVDGDPTFKISEDVTNESGTTWTQYLLSLPTGGDQTFVNDAWTSSDHFTSVSVSDYLVQFYNGTVNPSDTATFQFKINVPESSGPFSFLLTQTPVPEPATLTLMGLGVLGFVLRRKR